jgi:hypothetical protein
LFKFRSFRLDLLPAEIYLCCIMYTVSALSIELISTIKLYTSFTTC